MVYDPQEHKKAMGTAKMRSYAVDGEEAMGEDYEPQMEPKPISPLLGLAERLAEDAINPADFLQRILHDLSEQNGVLQSQHSDVEEAQKRISEEEQRLIHHRLRVEAQIEMVHVSAMQVSEQLDLYNKSQERLAKSFR